MKKSQSIDCTVHDCRYCDCPVSKCTLNCIKVSNCDGEGSKETTMCQSYNKKR